MLLIPSLLTAQLDDWDSDQDAMPNGWEFHRNLDVNDPKDAWQDPDGDGICNLYEYFLGTDPQDKSQPLFINYDDRQSLAEAIRKAGRGVVLRVPQGRYLLNYKHDPLSDPPRLLIQGGWNDDFSEQDHCRYPSVIDGGSRGAIFDFLMAAGTSAALLIDGFTLSGATRGVVQYTAYLAKAQLLLGNCTLVDNAAHRASSIINFEDGSSSLISDLVLINTAFTGNAGTVIRADQEATRTNFKVLHSTIAFNDYADNDGPPYSSGYGMDLQSDSDSIYHLQLSNSIFWGNANVEVKIKNLASERMEVESQSNIYGFIEPASQAVLFGDPSNRSIDPLLQSNGDYLFYPGDNSPVIKAGTNIGFSASDHPDIGPIYCDDLMATPIRNDSPVAMSWYLFPNPTANLFWLNGRLPRSGSVKTILYDIGGRPLRQVDHGWQSAGEVRLSLTTYELTAGTYYLEIQMEDWKVVKKIIRAQ